MDKMKREVIYIIQGFDVKTEKGELVDSVQIEVYAHTENEAIDRAKKYVKKPYYRVSTVIEK